VRHILMLAIATVVLVDVLGAVADANGFGFHFGWRGPLLVAVYFGAGFFAGRLGSVRAATIVGLASGSVDAAIAVIWAIGFGRLPDEYVGPVLVEIAVGIVVLAALFGALGGWSGRPAGKEAAA
jgi:hypothetical protein